MSGIRVSKSNLLTTVGPAPNRILIAKTNLLTTFDPTTTGPSPPSNRRRQMIVN